MKTSEFINELKKMGYEGEVSCGYYTIDIYPKGLDGAIASVRIDQRFTLEVGRSHHPVSEDLWALLIEYAATPVAEREDAFYHIRPKGLGQLGLESAFLWHDGEEWRLSDGRSEFTGDENLLYYTLRELEDLGVTKEMREDFYLEHVYGPREEEVEEELPTNDSLISKLLKDLESLSLKDKN